ncbi:CRAL/TRIO domain-containing protein [Chloropicon primus]|nr:CRAL/TRIO domain-containing protein [Chloropicon primus]UPQ97360.1 CRAL/TRIO domain-containing protein [Chloropicon primus]|eukprot:QDZ18148.1 CRAL/TRIO domain-containing protein [Chloropicon primus]
MAAAARRDDDGSSSSKSTTTRSSWLPSSKASASRGSSLGTSVDILRQATLKQVKGSVKRLSVILGNTFVALRDSVRSFALKHPEADHFFKTLDFRRMVYDDVSVLDAVDHAAMLKGRTMGKATLSRATIAKFLIARKYDLGKAHEMLAGYLEWRLTHSCVEDEQVAKSLEQDKVFVLRNTDKGGHVCVVIAVRKHLMHDVTLEETTRFIVYVIDKVAQTFLRKKKSMDKLTCIIDLQDIGYKNLDGDALKTILQLLQNFYPETLALMVLWKPPTIFWIVYKMIVPFVDPKTKGKILMAYNTKDLSKHFHAKRVPASLGGTGPEDLLVSIKGLQREDVRY